LLSIQSILGQSHLLKVKSTFYLEPYSYQPYDYLNSKYREDYPGYKPQMREKIVPRVKN
jgi:hypothetical protein